MSDGRPGKPNADEWSLFLEEHRQADGYRAVQICEAIEGHCPPIWLRRQDFGGHVYITVSIEQNGEWREVIRELFSAHGADNPGEISHIWEGQP